MVEQLPRRPGIGSHFLEESGVRHVTAWEARNLCGLEASGLWIPYRSISGKPVRRENDGPQDFGRLRLDQPTADGRRYHQRGGSKPYAYIPHNLQSLTLSSDLVIVEGEFKAMALAEAGISSLGVGGITSCFSEGQIVTGLREIVFEWPTVTRLLFLGDGDTSLIFAFSREAAKLARSLPEHITVVLPRIGIDGPGKGIDDVREALGTGFPAYWEKIVANAEPVSRDDTPEHLAVRMLKRETPNALRIAAGQCST